MKTYIVSLIRSYAVTIEAENEENACRHAEFFIGDCHDLSTYKDKQILVSAALLKVNYLIL